MDAKICGIRDSKTLNYIVNHNHPPKFIGFITNYPKSKRYIPYESLKELINIDKFGSSGRLFSPVSLWLLI